MLAHVKHEVREKIQRTREAWLNEEDRRRLQNIETIVTDLWHNDPGPPFYPLHDESHSAYVEYYIGELIPSSKAQLLTEGEKFCLLASAWLHDLGMQINQAGEHPDYDLVRKEHHTNSANRVREKGIEWGLDQHESTVIASMCRFHRKRENINNATQQYGRYRVRLLSSYLRLADALHIDSTRVPMALHKLYTAVGMSWKSRLHWLKSQWITSVHPNPTEMVLNVSINCPVNDARFIEAFEEFIRDEIEEELYSVREVLIHGQVSYYLSVAVETSSEETDASHQAVFRQLVSDLIFQSVASSSDLESQVIQTVIWLASGDNKMEALNTVSDYFEKEIERLINERPCHVLLRRVANVIRQETKTPSLTQDQRSAEAALDNLIRNLKGLSDKRQDAKNALVKNARSLLLDCEPILLFGFSKLVLAALDDLPDQTKRKTSIYISECASKSKYNYRNELAASDGMAYAIAVAEAKFNDVNLLPDDTVASFMACGKIKKVVLGANGVDPVNGVFGHTAGHLMISDLARAYDIPVYVIADTWKFGRFTPDPELERDEHWWLKSCKSVQDKIKASKVSITLLNLREDCVNLNSPQPAIGTKTYMLVTELGVFPANKIPREVMDSMD